MKRLPDPNNLSIFAATESATLPLRPANQGGSFAFMTTLRLYTKQALSFYGSANERFFVW